MEWKLTLQLRPKWSSVKGSKPWGSRMVVKGWRIYTGGWNRFQATFQWWRDD